MADNTKTLSQEAILADEVLVLTRRTPRTDNQVFPGALPSAMDDVDYQKKIESEIIQKNIQDNLASAYEFHPETFANVSMLYISCLVNDLPVKAFVDCGAQVTICKCVEDFDVFLFYLIFHSDEKMCRKTRSR